MANYLLDTNHASPLVTLSHPLRQRILIALQNEHTFAISVPVLAETIFGISLLPRASQNLAEWSNIRQLVSCYMVDEDDAEQAARLQIALRRRGRQLETIDALIAALALRYDLILLTTDNDFQTIPELKHENWLVWS